MKGWRTVGYNILSTVVVVTGVAVTVNVADLGVTGDAAAWAVAGIKIADAVANLWLRLITNTAVGKAE
jgi:hypothetical protein